MAHQWHIGIQIDRKTMKKVTLALLIFLSLPGWSRAQKAWTLQECIDYAVAHNLQVKDRDLTVQQERESHRQSVRDLLPTINGSSDYGIRYGRSTNPNDNTITTTDFFSNSYNLQSSLDIFRGLQKLNTIKATKLLYKAVNEEVLQEKFLLAFRVMTAYYDIRYYEGQVAIAEEQLQISEHNHTLVSRQLELGLKAQADLYEADSNLEGDRLIRTQALNQLQAAQLTLVQEMNLDGETGINLVDDPEPVSESGLVVATSDSIYSKAIDFLPGIRGQMYRTEASKKGVAIAKGGLLPSLSLFASYGTGYYETITDSLGNTVPFKDQFSNNASRYVGISLNVPIFNGLSGWSRIKQQKIAQMREENNLALREQELRKTIEQLLQSNGSLVTELEQSHSQVKSQELAFEAAQKKYERGLINILDLSTSKNQLAMARNKNLQTRMLLAVNRSTLDFYQGLDTFNLVLEQP